MKTFTQPYLQVRLSPSLHPYNNYTTQHKERWGDLGISVWPPSAGLRFLDLSCLHVHCGMPSALGSSLLSDPTRRAFCGSFRKEDPSVGASPIRRR